MVQKGRGKLAFSYDDLLHDFGFWLEAADHKNKAIAIYRERVR